MRELKMTELEQVAGGLVCTPENTHGQIDSSSGSAQSLIGLHAGLVKFASHVIERVATAW